MSVAFDRAELAALGYVERSAGHWEKVREADAGSGGAVSAILNNREPDEQAVRPESKGVVPSTVQRSAYRSKWESERALLLANLKLNGQIADYRYEPMRLRLADGAWYKPDFLVEETDGTLTLEEVKGHWREAALVRYKVARSLYPMFHFRAVTKRNGQWVDAMEGKR